MTDDTQDGFTQAAIEWREARDRAEFMRPASPYAPAPARRSRKAGVVPATPEPLIKLVPPSALYPIDALGDVLGDAAEAIAAKIQCPPAMAAQSALGVASLAAQALADVALPYGQTRPLSLFLLTIAASGDRKSSADNEAMIPVRMREAQLREEYNPIAQAHDTALAVWRAQRSQAERGKKKACERHDEIAELGPEPQPPLKPKLTLNETTVEGLARHMPELHGALGIFSAEAGQLLSGHGFSSETKLRSAAVFSQLWDGSGLSRLRSGGGLDDLRGRRVAAHLMIQPQAAAAVLGDPVLYDQGLLSRLLTVAPESLAGTRLWREPAAGLEPALSRYAACIMSIFEMPVTTAIGRGNELTPRIVGLSSAARLTWIDFHNEVECGMRPGGRFAEMRDVGGKSAEQAARIAGVLAIVANPEAATINGETMARGCVLAKFYLDEARRIAEEVRIPPEVADAQTLLAWMRALQLTNVTASRIQKNGPNLLRSKGRMDPAVSVLEEKGWLIADGASGRAWRVVPA